MSISDIFERYFPNFAYGRIRMEDAIRLINERGTKRVPLDTLTQEYLCNNER